VKRLGVTLLSGGLDSTTVTALARGQVDHLTAITFHYGQTHSKEVLCAREISRILGVRHELVDIASFGKVAWYSSLTSPRRFQLPRDRISAAGPATGAQAAPAIPNTYVPLRNTFFLTLAGAYLESLALQAIEEDNQAPEEVEAHIYIAPNAIDYSGYPDCRPEYYEKVREALMYGSKLWTQYGVPIRIETPIIHMSKADIVRMGLELKAPLERTWSCYQAGELPCGTCDSCVLRARGFAQAGCPDPLLVRLGDARA
jgi:7-cyano-7-deazaguanine synthase